MQLTVVGHIPIMNNIMSVDERADLGTYATEHLNMIIYIQYTVYCTKFQGIKFVRMGLFPIKFHRMSCSHANDQVISKLWLKLYSQKSNAVVMQYYKHYWLQHQ